MVRKPSRFQVQLTPRPLDLAQALRLVGCPEAVPSDSDDAHGSAAAADSATGAVVGFTGIIRAMEGGRRLRGIQYEQYRSMAIKEMKRILDEARARWTLQGAVVLHRTGATPVGHPSVAVAVAAGHRGEAFDAARYLIDTVKERVPLWKNFLYEGDAEGKATDRNTDKATDKNTDKIGRNPPRSRALWLAVPLQSPPESPAEFARRARAAGANAIELRADALSSKCRLSPEAIRSLAAELRAAEPGLFLILTPRARAEGGGATFSIARRKEIIETCLAKVDAVDVELHSGGLAAWAAERAAAAGKQLILSNHDFEKTPSIVALDALFSEAAAWPEAILKIAAATPRRNDLVRLVEWTRRRAAERPLATMSMGVPGRAGRVLLAALGSRLAFATLGEASAPGQIDVRIFNRALRRVRAMMKASPPPSTRAGLKALIRRTEEILSEL